MRRCQSAPVLFLACLGASESAHACMVSAPFDPKDVRHADVVLIGRISDYHIVRDTAFRRQMLANPKLPRDMRKYYKGDHGLLTDYAEFNIRVEQVLVGTAPRSVAVTWANSTFGEPDALGSGPFLIALRRPSSAMPPLRGPSATIMPNREPHTLTVLQAPCSSPFLFPTSSEQARTVQSLLAAPPSGRAPGRR